MKHFTGAGWIGHDDVPVCANDPDALDDEGYCKHGKYLLDEDCEICDAAEETESEE